MTSPANPPWPEPVIERLRALWAEGHSGAVIGRRLRVSRNAVLGKVHRLNLPPRTNPIGRGNCGLGELKQPRPPRRIGATGSTVMPVGAGLLYLTPPQPARPQLMKGRNWLVEAPRVTLPAMAVAEAELPLPTPFRAVRCACKWPMWGDGKPTHEYCGVTSMPGRPYCRLHSEQAFVRVGPVNMQGVAA